MIKEKDDSNNICEFIKKKLKLKEKIEYKKFLRCIK